LLFGHQGKKKQGILSLNRYKNLDTNDNQFPAGGWLSTNNCGLLKEKSSKKENSNNSINMSITY